MSHFHGLSTACLGRKQEKVMFSEYVYSRVFSSKGDASSELAVPGQHTPHGLSPLDDTASVCCCFPKTFHTAQATRTSAVLQGHPLPAVEVSSARSTASGSAAVAPWSPTRTGGHANGQGRVGVFSKTAASSSTTHCTKVSPSQGAQRSSRSSRVLVVMALAEKQNRAPAPPRNDVTTEHPSYRRT